MSFANHQVSRVLGKSRAACARHRISTAVARFDSFAGARLTLWVAAAPNLLNVAASGAS
jgi:hypothetical protein